ncbi:hypothetical protein E2C01_068693 [Portunus trituberculatus]|uniref:Uncharacterized protein n=1 Tax=Portunus trituberculatus TaxID=210409 RepID=A0A5B7HWV0_PORTR|nr:hypothetical protein [Portunus trituberculatus]
MRGHPCSVGGHALVAPSVLHAGVGDVHMTNDLPPGSQLLPHHHPGERGRGIRDRNSWGYSSRKDCGH